MDLMKIFLIPIFVISSALVTAKPIDFDFKDPKGVNNIIFQMDAPLESINGSGDSITGKVTFEKA